MDELEDDQNPPIKSPIKRYGSTRKIYLFNSKYESQNKFRSRHSHGKIRNFRLIVRRS